MIGTINDPRIAVQIGAACGAAARDVRDRLERSVRREVHGQAAAREEGFTDDLADAMDAIGSSLEAHLQAASDGLQAAASNVRIEFNTQKAKQGEERDFGLDLGIRVTIETPGYAVDKAILVQCKRMYGAGRSGRFPALAGDGERQAEEMLKLTPASFFFLFNSESAGELGEMLRSVPFDPWEPYWRPVWRHEPYFEPGVTVLPASRVLALSRAAKAKKAPFPTSASDVLAGSTPLGHFVAGLFASRFVGDLRTLIIQLATPPSLRDSVTGVSVDVPALGALNAERFFRLKVTKVTPTSAG